MNRAFAVTITTWAGVTHIVAATTPGKAAASQYRDANSVGYRIPYVNFRVRRAKQYDSVAALEPGSEPVVIGIDDRNDGIKWGCIPQCQSTNHRRHRGELWQCENCHKWVCENEGTDNHPELCDDCWAEKFQPTDM